MHDIPPDVPEDQYFVLSDLPPSPGQKRLALGIVLGLMAAAASVRSARNGSGGAAFAAALFGGLCMLAASGSLAVAIVLGLLAASA